MTIDRHRTIEPPSSPPGVREGSFARAGRLHPAAFAAALAVLLSGAAPATAEPTPSRTSWLNAIEAAPGTLVDTPPTELFDNAGTNPRIIFASLSTRDDSGRIPFHVWDVYEQASSPALEGDGVQVKAKTEAQLNALSDPPPATFYVKATVMLANDEGDRVEGSYFYKTTYTRNPAPLPAAAPPPPPQPFFNKSALCIGAEGHLNAPPGILISTSTDDCFDNPGTNPVFTAVTFSTTEFYDTAEIRTGYVSLRAKSAADLRALPEPPSNPFEVEAAATMTNDEGQTATATFTYRTGYDTREPETVPVFIPQDKIDAPVGIYVQKYPARMFHNAGTNPRLTEANFSTTEYYDDHLIVDGHLRVRAKSDGDLNALSSPPSSPFEVTVDVKMTNDEGEAASGTLTFATTYDTDAPATLPGAPKPKTTTIPPVFMSETLVVAPAGILIVLSAEDTYVDDLGKNPKFTEAKFSTTDYYDESRILNGRLRVKAKSEDDLNALPSPPSGRFGVEVELTITNEEGGQKKVTLTFDTMYLRTESTSTPPPVAPTAQQPASSD